MAELALNHPSRMPHFGAHAGLELLTLSINGKRGLKALLTLTG